MSRERMHFQVSNGFEGLLRELVEFVENVLIEGNLVALLDNGLIQIAQVGVTLQPLAIFIEVG